ncbi:MAG: GGDEF domain-containing protein [Parashewanella sp.]
MSTLFLRARTVLLPIIVTFFTLLCLTITEDYWQTWRPIIRQLPFWLLLVSLILSLQFNRSRLGYLSIILLLLYAVERSFIFDSQWLHQYSLSFFIAASIGMGYLCWIQDRAMVSVHGVINLIVLAITTLFAFGWDKHIAQNVTNVLSQYSSFIDIQTISLIPWVLSLVAISIKAMKQASLTHSAIVITFILSAIEYFWPLQFSTAILFSLLALVYLVSILVDSYALAYQDELTGLSSRRALYNLVLSLGQKYSVAMMDIDHFKKFNDTYGHDVGDEVLKLVASKLSKIEGGGKVFRYGGEEFTVVFPRKTAEDTIDYLDDIRQTIEDYDIVIRNKNRKQDSKDSRGKGTSKRQTVSVTISIGVADHRRGEKFDNTLKNADIALYKAKQQGRNQVCL